MQTVIRNVKDIEPNERHCLEGTLGRQLQENQQVIICVIDLNEEPDEATRGSRQLPRIGRGLLDFR